MKAAIIVDSTAGLSKEVADIPGIFQLYLSTIFEDGTVFVDTADDELTQQFYDRMTTEDELPKSSQPEPKQVFDLFDRIIAEGYDTVFGLFLSEKISGTFQTVNAVAKEYDDKLTIHLIDSKTTSFVIEAMTINLVELLQRDLTAQKIIEHLDELLSQSIFYFTPETLTNLVKGGRLSSFSGLLGSLLSIKPLITVSQATDGEVHVPEKIRSKKKAINRLFTLASEAISRYPETAYITIGHTGAPSDAQELSDRILAAFPNCSTRIGFITPVLGTHGGRGAVSINIAPLLNNQ